MADVENAGTDDAVRARLNANNSTWMDYGRDDFERDGFYLFDLTLEDVSLIQDITQLEIFKTKSNGMCIEAIELRVNNRPIYSQSFAASSPPGLWLDNADGHSTSVVLSYEKLRAAPEWESYALPPAPTFIPNRELDSRIEGIVGDAIHGNCLKWNNGDAVEVRRADGVDNAVHVDLDLKCGVDDWFDPSVDVDFDLVLSCADGQMTLAATNVDIDVDADFLSKILTLGIAELIANKVGGMFENMFEFTETYAVGDCPSISVSSGGDFVLSYPQ